MSLIVGGKSVRRRIRRNHFYFVIILILFASIGVGYAALTSTISINGTTQITSAKWDVHFANCSIGANTSGNYAQPSITENGTKLTISSIGLNAGYEVEFYIDVVNAGSIDARLSGLVKSNLTTEQKKYLSYTVTYGFNTPIKENDLLKAGTSERIRISIVYSDDKTLAPTTQQTISNLTFRLDYVQDKGNGIARPKLCKRATTLHTGTVGTSTTTVNYGQIGTSGKLASGDAFDCDVNGDGTYDAATERFYYVTDLDGDANTAVLIFYGNSDSSGVYLVNRAYYSSNNYSGPTTIVRQLPTTSAWPRVGLIKNTSQIYNDKGGTTAALSTNTITTYNLPKYTYRTAARLLTYQEYQKITDNSFLWENFGDGGQMAGCIWLNTPQDSTGMANAVFAISNPTSSILAAMPYNGASKLCGPRPVIEVLKTDMIY
jgi:hypothetical protein